MKFAHGMSTVDTIKKYTVTDDEIKVTSLTDVNYPVALSDEHILIKIMLEQANERNQKVDFDEIRKKLKTIVSRMMLEGGIISVNIISSIMGKEYDDIRAIIQFAVVISSILLTLDIKDFIEENKEYEELEKYRIFLEIREELEKIKSSIIIGSKTMDTEKININTIDDYSLNDIKKLKKYLTK